MPDEDKTGPFGTGPIGRGLGPCGSGQPGWGRGRGLGYGGRRGRYTTPVAFSAEEEKHLLEQQKSWLERQLAAIVQRLQANENKEE
jgi:hypothetical protein